MNLLMNVNDQIDSVATFVETRPPPYFSRLPLRVITQRIASSRFGVLHNGAVALPGAVELIEKLKRRADGA